MTCITSGQMHPFFKINRTNFDISSAITYVSKNAWSHCVYDAHVRCVNLKSVLLTWKLDWCWMSVGCRRDFQVSVFCLHTDFHPSQRLKTSSFHRGSQTSVCSAWAAPCTGSGLQPCAWKNSCSRVPQWKDCPLHFSWTGPFL